MKRILPLALAAASVATAALAPLYARTVAPALTPFAAEVASGERPDADKLRDEDRKPGQVMAFAGIAAGQKVVELAPGGGYYTRLLSLALGPQGKLYPRGGRIGPAVEEWAKGHANTMPAVSSPDDALAPEPVDVVWTTLNYHDFKNNKVGDKTLAEVTNTRAFAALKPGGIYLINDHAAAKGSPADVTSTLHRIEEAVVIREVEAAGFKLDGKSALLAHPADYHSQKVFEGAVRGKTDQFLLKFRKPKGKH